MLIVSQSIPFLAIKKKPVIAELRAEFHFMKSDSIKYAIFVMFVTILLLIEYF